MTLTIGVDLGLTGALVALTPTGIASAYDMPRIDKEFSSAGLAALFKQWPMATVVLEAAQHVRIPERPDSPLLCPSCRHSIPRKIPSSINPKSTSVLFECQGLVKALCAANGLRLVVVTPKQWQSALLRSAGSGTTKQRARVIAERLWPGHKLKVDQIDAALIGAFGQYLAAGRTVTAPDPSTPFSPTSTNP